MFISSFVGKQDNDKWQIKKKDNKIRVHFFSQLVEFAFLYLYTNIYIMTIIYVEAYSPHDEHLSSKISSDQ